MKYVIGAIAIILVIVFHKFALKALAFLATLDLIVVGIWGLFKINHPIATMIAVGIIVSFILLFIKWIHDLIKS